MKLGICTGFEHVETKTEEVVFREEVDFLSSLAFVVHPASPSGAIFILAGGHVRASAGALAVHTALIPRICFTSIAIDRARRSSPVARSCQRSEVFRLQTKDVTWPGVACVCKSMTLGMHSV